MHRYQPRTPRIAIALAAIALTAVTMAGTVLWPAVAETARATGIGPDAVTTASGVGHRRVVELQCAPQG